MYFKPGQPDDSKEIHIVPEGPSSVTWTWRQHCASQAEATNSTVCALCQMSPVGLIFFFAFPSFQQLLKRFSQCFPFKLHVAIVISE